MKNNIEFLLQQAFEPTLLKVKDESHLHAGHAHAKPSGSHMYVRIVSEAFEGMNRVKRHKAIYEVLNLILNPEDGTEGLHALRMNVYTPEEWNKKEAS